MNCTHIEKLIPLYTGGDLDSGQTLEVRLHIENCEHCREVAAAFEESRDWMSGLGAPPIEEAIFDDLRETVHREIRRTKRDATTNWHGSLLNGRYGIRILAATMILLLLAALAIYGFRHQSAPPQVVNRHSARDEAPPKPEEPKVVETDKRSSPPRISKHPLKHPGHRLDPAVIQVASPAIAESPAPAGQTAETPIWQPVDVVAAAKEQEMLRIEFQTADPKIRIIWLVARDSGEPQIKSDSNNPEEDGGPE
jgi:hypothetical protein